MRRRRFALLALVAAAAVAVTLAGDIDLVDRWTASELPPDPFTKILVVAITDDRVARGKFEDLFVSHLRGQGIEGVSSREIVPDLEQIDNADEIVAWIEKNKVDGVISVRAVYLKEMGQKTWEQHWENWISGNQSLEGLIEDTLPLERPNGGKVGVEVALWDTDDDKRLWSARTEPVARKQLKKAPPAFVQSVMNALYNVDLL